MRAYAAGAVAAAVVLALAYGPSYVGYDAAWSLAWGAELADGRLPSYEVPYAPTPHPLANLVAAPLSLAGGDEALRALTFLAFGALVAGAWALGAEIGGIVAGAVAALLVATRSDLGREAAFGSVDLPFLALVVWATVAAARSRPGLALALLVPAGLLRPEAWGLSAAALAWAVLEPAGGARASSDRGGGRPIWALAALALAAPVLWVLSDLVVTGDPLHSLHGTRDLAAQLARPRGAGTALSSLDDGLRDLAGTLPLLAGVLGAGLAVWAGTRRAALIACAAVIVGVAGFVAIGAAGLPVLFRYLLVPATLWLVLAGGGFGATVRRVPAAALVVAVLLAASVPATVDDIARAREFTLLRAEVHGDLLAVTRAAAFRDAAARCGPVVVPGFRARPFVLVANEDAVVRVGNLPDGERGVLITYADELSELVFNLGAPGEAQQQSAPLNSRRLAENPSWRAYSVC
jgi:hypothetical protein